MGDLKKTKEELISHLKEQISFLKSSCELFDSGQLHESKRIATTIRVIIHDTPKSTSLLTLLGLKDKIQYLDTGADYDPKNLLPQCNILMISQNSSGPTYKAPLGTFPPFFYSHQSFKKWWDKIILSDNSNVTFSRKDVVLFLANKEGGAHVDKSIKTDYVGLKNGKYLGWSFTKDGVNYENIPDPHAHAVRQIAYELLSVLLQFQD